MTPLLPLFPEAFSMPWDSNLSLADVQMLSVSPCSQQGGCLVLDLLKSLLNLPAGCSVCLLDPEGYEWSSRAWLRTSLDQGALVVQLKLECLGNLLLVDVSASQNRQQWSLGFLDPFLGLRPSFCPKQRSFDLFLKCFAIEYRCLVDR